MSITENIYDPACELEPELTEHAIIETMEQIAADVADQGGQWTANQRIRYQQLKYGN